jgi:heme exporter protein D
MQLFTHFLQMGGFALEVFTAYGLVILFLLSQWLLAYRQANKQYE